MPDPNDPVLAALRGQGVAVPAPDAQGNVINYGPAATAVAPNVVGAPGTPLSSQQVLASILSGGSAPAAPASPGIVIAHDSQASPEGIVDNGPSMAELAYGRQNTGASSGISTRQQAIDEAISHNRAQEQLAQASLGLRQQEAQHAQASQILDMVEKSAKLQDEIKHRADTADFITNLQNIPHDDPRYEEKIGNLAAQFSRAAGPTVDLLLKTKGEARARHLKGAESGGAAEFTGPAQETYISTFHDTSDRDQARAAAKATEAGVQSMRKGLADGTITPDDVKAATSNVNGRNVIDYNALATQAATVAGQATGKPATVADRELQHARAFVEAYAKNPQALEDNPNLKSLYDINVRKLVEHEKGKNPDLGTATNTTSTAASLVP